MPAGETLILIDEIIAEYFCHDKPIKTSAQTSPCYTKTACAIL
jgi:hypothetical protein